MPAGCPSCASEGAPANVAPVYGRMTALRPGRTTGYGTARFITQLPVARDRLISMGEGDTPLLATHALGPQLGLRRLLLKDERQNPTGSWRDRFATMAISQIEDTSLTVGCAGDEAMCVSVASYAARAGVRSVSLVEPGVSDRTRDAIEAVGGRVVAVTAAEGRWPLLAEAERVLGWRALSNRAAPPIGGDPLAAEGYRTIAYEIAEQLRFAAPDLVIVPAGLGDGIQGIWRGFREMVSWGLLDRIPRMVAVELGGAVASALAGGKDWVAPTGLVESPARSLAGVTGTVQTLHAVVESEGLVVRVSDAELEQARMQLGELEGIWADLAAAAPIAAVIKLAQRGDVPARTVVVAVVTEHGVSDASSAAPGVLETVDGRVDDLLRVLAVRGE
ncbi:MAG TPA: pyridoxal-phosphate dependent enzyme [Gaiellales bacterium]|nr:pyridoxal-phosphate dependent enzyme [Gaiellales bacterium]